MTETNEKKPFDLDILGVKELNLKLFGPLAGAAGSTLQDAWELVFGGFGNYVAKKRESRRKDLEDFKASLENKVNNIPDDKICEPPLSIIGPALDASKYYFEDSVIREMFASIISASMDSRTVSRTHRSFPIIIQQMSTLDAKNLEYIYSTGDLLPICQYQVVHLKNDTDFDDELPFLNPRRTIETNVFLPNSDMGTLQERAASLTLLESLGLVSINYELSIEGDEYKGFDETPEYLSIQEQCKEKTDETPYIQHGVVSLTPLGEDLCTICFPN